MTALFSVHPETPVFVSDFVAAQGNLDSSRPRRPKSGTPASIVRSNNQDTAYCRPVALVHALRSPAPSSGTASDRAAHRSAGLGYLPRRHHDRGRY
jgi:hypothetical protein